MEQREKINDRIDVIDSQTKRKIGGNQKTKTSNHDKDSKKQNEREMGEVRTDHETNVPHGYKSL